MMLEREFIGTSEAAKILGVSRRTVWRAVRNGDIAGTRFRKKWLIKKSDIDKLCKCQ